MAKVANVDGQPTHFRDDAGHVEHLDTYPTNVGERLVEIKSLRDADGNRTGHRVVRVGVKGKKGTFSVNVTPEDTKAIRAAAGINRRGRTPNGLFIVHALGTKGITLGEVEVTEGEGDSEASVDAGE